MEDSMSKRPSMPGWGRFLEQIRERLEMDEATFYAHFKAKRTTYLGWFNGSSTSLGRVFEGLDSLGLWDIPVTLAWIASDGKRPAPRWLAKSGPDPRTPPSGSDVPESDEGEGLAPIVAFPTAALDAYREALSELDELQRVNG